MDYYRLGDKLTELQEFAEKGLTDLKSTGLVALDEFYMIKKGYPLFVAGNPGAGKTEFVFEILVNTSILYGWKHFIYCGEGGNIEHIYHDLIHKYLQKKYKYATGADKIRAEYFMTEHFVLANHDKDYTIEEFYSLAQKAEDELNIKFDTTCFDPFNDIKDETDKFQNREDKYLAHALKQARVSSKKNNRMDILVNHVADVAPKNDPDTGESYLPPALPTQWAGGRTWWRRAFVMIVIYKPYTFRKDANNRNFEENEGHVIIQKYKPKGVGKKGTVSIYWDWEKNRYYCKVNGQDLYSCESLSDYLPKSISESKLHPNTEFVPINQQDEDHPF